MSSTRFSARTDPWVPGAWDLRPKRLVGDWTWYHGSMDGHELNDERSLWLHRAVADKARREAEILSKARQRVESWLADGSTHPRYAEAWRHLLSSEPEEVLKRLVDPGETMRALRQCSPFAGALDPRERWRILRQVREARG